MMRGARNYFSQIQAASTSSGLVPSKVEGQGGEAGKSSKQALTAEPTLELAKIVVADTVAHSLVIGGVALALQDRFGYCSDSRVYPMAKFRSNATHHSFSEAPLLSFGFWISLLSITILAFS